jgi:succinylglutamic semialdehyde dehydrogenase
MHYINGEWLEVGSHRFSSLNPATQQPIWEGWAAGEAEVSAAVKAARMAFPAWAMKEYADRYEIVSKFKKLTEERKDELALLIAQETGKALWDARSEAAAVTAKLTYADEAYHERTGVKSRETQVGKAIVTHRPHGVMAVYGPYNFPAHLPNGHIIPALLAGNTLVFKPSEQTPFVAEWMVKRWIEAGLPTGVLNLIQGERDTGIALAKSSINGVLFTGSSATGKALHAQFAGRPEIILALEMGGNNPLLVDAVANIPAAVHETLLSAFTGTGQRCTCARRLIVLPWEKSNEYINQLINATEGVVVGAYDSEPSPFMGPLISLKETTRLLAAQEALEKLGGKILVRMRQPDPQLPFVTPGIIDMTGVADVPDEEFFGPLLQLYRARDAIEAIILANRTAYGLSASVVCDDPAQYQSLSHGIQAGLINWNRQTTGASGAGPFGGIGISGNHRPAGYYSADYCSYPVASVEVEVLSLPEQLPPGLSVG